MPVHVWLYGGRLAHRGILEEGVKFIQKPFSMDDLAVQVREALEMT